MIRLEGVTKRFRGAAAPAVDALDLEVPQGEIVMLVGPSGCGKTTTLKMINRLVEPSSGSIQIDGEDVLATPPHELRRRIGYVIQQIGLFPHRTIAQNIATVPELLGWDEGRIQARVDELIELMHLDPAMLGRFPSELSGGQRQRVGVARALAADPPVLLMDEPFGAVDPLVRARLQEQLLQLQHQVQKTIVFVTHDIDEAIRLGDRIAVLNIGARLEQFAPPAELLAKPATDFVAAFLGSERGLRRLALLPVRDLDLDHGPVVHADDGAAAARRAMNAYGVDWFGVTSSDGRALGWAWGTDLQGVDDLADLPLRPFAASIQADASLREALDAIVTTQNNVAVVCDGDTYVGMLFVDHVGAELIR
ncbi:MAG: ABC transporter ATP-binding protein [Actinobacteria bacterium]|nr:ABC transporter ATP-binding protein [Actinomycetota bacterium]